MIVMSFSVEKIPIEIKFTVRRGEYGIVNLYLPPNKVCVTRHYQVYFPNVRKLRYGWKIDSLTKWSVPMHYYVPNTDFGEIQIFGKNLIKWRFLRFEYEALESGTVKIRTEVELIDYSDLAKFLEEKLRQSKLAKIIKEIQVKPPLIEKPVIHGEKVIECTHCGAKMYREIDEKGREIVIRIGEWGRNYSDHQCQVFS